MVSGSLRGALESICVVRGMGSRLWVGARSSSNTRRRFGPATSSACGRSSFKRFMCSSLLITPTGKFSTSKRRGIRRPNGQAGRSSSAAAGIGSHRAFSSTIVTGDGAVFDRRVRALGITQIRTPFRSPQANSVAERWVGSLRRECLDYVFIFNERHLRAVLAEYVRYLNDVSCCPTSLCA